MSKVTNVIFAILLPLLSWAWWALPVWQQCSGRQRVNWLWQSDTSFPDHFCIQ